MPKKLRYSDSDFFGKRTIDFSEPTGTNRQKKKFKLDPKSKDIVYIHAV
jgi:hypothetical protein